MAIPLTRPADKFRAPVEFPRSERNVHAALAWFIEKMSMQTIGMAASKRRSRECDPIKTLCGRRQESASDLLVAGALCCRYGLPLMKNCRILRNKIATNLTKPVANLSFPQKTVINRSLKKKYFKKSFRYFHVFFCNNHGLFIA